MSHGPASRPPGPILAHHKPFHPSSSSVSSSPQLPSAPAPPPASALPPTPTLLPFPSSTSAPFAATPARATTPGSNAPRQRGESSPAGSRHATHASSSTFSNSSNGLSEEFANSRSFGRRGSAVAPESSTSTSMSTSSSRRTDARQETREDRRARKERERDGIEQGVEDEGTGSAPRREHRSRSSANRSEDVPGDEFASMSLGSPPLASASSAAASSRSQTATASSATASSSSSSSKSVLTIALQRAQSAVLLDSANNVPAAIAAYSQSVRLLKEVMARVEEGARRDRERAHERGGDRYAIRPGETEEEAQKRIAKNERKERAKMDEARRLKVIHDTYEDRVRMLISMNTEQVDSDHDSGPRTPTTTDSYDHVVAPPMVSRRSQNRSISSLGTVSTPPATFESPSESQRPSVDERTATALTLDNSLLQRPSLGEEERSGLSSGRGSISSDGTATVMSRKQTLIAREDEHAVESIVTPPSAPARTDSHARSTSADSDGSDDRVPVTARETGIGWPTEHEREATLTPATYARPEPVEVDDVHADHEAHTRRPSQTFAMRRTASDQPPAGSNSMSTTSSDEMRRGASASGGSPTMVRHESGDSLLGAGVRTSSLFATGSSPRAEDAARFADGRPRPVRAATTSISATGTSIMGGSTLRRSSGPLLVSDSPSTGTISQRRRSPQPSSFVGLETIRHSGFGDDGEGFEALRGQNGEDEDDEDPTVRVRTRSIQGNGRYSTSASPAIPSEFGLVSGPEGSYSSASLPTRLRTYSQPGKRPSLASSQSEQRPPIPPLLTSAQRSVSGDQMQAARKNSIPTPTSANSADYAQAPRLMRENSVSSQGSQSERDGVSRGAPSPSWGYLATLPSSGEPPASANSFGTASMGRQNTIGSSYATSPSLESSPLPPPPLIGAMSPDASGGSPSPLRRPFHLMRQILQTIETDGGYVTPTLYIPHQIWSQAGVKLVAVETKVRMLDLLLTGLEGVDKAGKLWWRAEGARDARDAATRFAKELEAFEGLIEGIQSTLSKKLGFASTGKKTGATSFSAWSSKLSRSLDRVTNGRSLDHPATYVDGISRVFHQAQCLDAYLVTLSERGFPYSELSERERAQLGVRLKRISEFFGNMICRFVLRDIAMLVDKYVKRAGVWFAESG